MQARPVKTLGPRSQLVDVSGAPSLEAAIDAYRGDPRVRFAEPDLIMHVIETPNDTRFGDQWNLMKIQAPEAWDRTHGSTDIRVAILDTGIRESHPDLSGRVVARRNFSGSAFGTQDANGHGTRVAGVAAAVTNHSDGIAGLAYNVSLLNGKTNEDDGTGAVSMLVEGIRWAVASRADVINMSLGGSGDFDSCSPTFFENWFDFGRNELRDAINEAWNSNVVLVAGAGNNGHTDEHYPAACPNVLAVGGTDRDDNRASSSNSGAWVDVAAPGTEIWTTRNDDAGSYMWVAGTSFATPHVSGLAALVKASCHSTSAASIVNRITANADQIAGTGSLWQHGRINAKRAVCIAPPTDLHTAGSASNGIQLEWTDPNVPGDTRTEVRWRPHNGSTWTTRVFAANTEGWTHRDVTPNAGYDYQVRVCVGPDCSSYSNTHTEFAGTEGFRLNITINGGGGRVTSATPGIACPTDCADTYASGTSVMLTARDTLAAGTEYVFQSWAGACSGTQDTCTLTMDSVKNVTARFIEGASSHL
jgi:thermitase